jgi:hypothetical protein
MPLSCSRPESPSAPLPALRTADLLDALRTYGGQQAAIVAQNPKLLKATFDLLKSVQDGNPVAGTSAVVSGFSAGATNSSTNKVVKVGAKSASLVMSTFKASMDLAKVARLTTPGAVGVFVGATAMQKTGLAVSFMAGDSDSDRAKCLGAVLELSGSLAVTALTAPTGILLWLSLASLTASTYNAYLSCAPLAH